VSVRRRLEALEGRAMPRQHISEAEPCHSDARRHLMEHLDRVAALRRGELGPEEAAEVEATTAAIRSRARWLRGEGRR
jgi:hypothetical protein